MFPGPPRRDQSDVRYSIIITSFNQSKFIRDAVDSAVGQRFPSKEIIVVDDGSQDGSAEILKTYGASVRLELLPANEGAARARNAGAAVARGEYVIFLDGDDLLTPWALDVYNLIIGERHPSTIVSGARWFAGEIPVLTESEKPRRVQFVQYGSLMAKDRGGGLSIGAFVIRRRVFEQAGGWTPEIFQLDGQDLYAKLGYSGTSVLVCSPYTLFYRMHSANTIRFVPPFIESAHLILARERAGFYPGGWPGRLKRYARHGGTVLFCARRGFRAGLHKQAWRLAINGFNMILALIVWRLFVMITGRAKIETRELG